MKKVLFLFSLFVIILGTIFVYQDRLANLYLDFFQKITQREKITVDFSIKEIEKKVLTPGPFRAPRESPQSFLTRAGVIQWTNVHRKENRLPLLSENLKLNAAAALKLQDMFEKQYFAHVSPSGIRATDLLKEVGYNFIVSGENLALGNFKDDKDLVQGWMDSPGHRENVLNERYQEIGVAVSKGIYEGEQTWLAVQVFGLPLSFCPEPDKSLQIRIEVYKNQIEGLQKIINSLKIEIEAMHPKRGVVYNQKIREYNNFVDQYNELVEKTKDMILEFNTQIELFNECARG